MFHKSGFIREQYKLGVRREDRWGYVCFPPPAPSWATQYEEFTEKSGFLHHYHHTPLPPSGGEGRRPSQSWAMCRPWCSAPRSSWLYSSTLPRLFGKHQKWERCLKTGQISACVHGLRACMSVHVCIYKYVGTCAHVRVCMQRPQHGTGYLPWLFSTICPEVGSLNEAEFGYVLPSCSVDPWTLDYTWATFYMPGF